MHFLTLVDPVFSGLAKQKENRFSFQHIMHLSYCTLAAQVKTNKRYAAAGEKGFTVAQCAQNVKDAVGSIDVLVHSLANGPEVAKPLLETSRKVQVYYY